LSPKKVLLRVPATSANLGPGFDCLGLALDLWAQFTLEARDAPMPPPDDPLLGTVLAAASACYAAAAVEAPAGLSVAWQGDIPVARGLGASAVARAAGLVGANALAGDPLGLEELLPLGAELEHHADNIAPALLGGLQVAVWDGQRVTHVAVPLPPRLKVVLLVPERTMPTDESRRLLPSPVPRDDAVFNVGRVALLVAALAAGRLDLLDTATADRLHQPARSRLLPGMDQIMAAARRAGALCAYLSGGGSTIAAWTLENEEAIADAMRRAADVAGSGGRTIITKPSEKGAEVIKAE
jgi:homoserine kinase